MKIIFAFIICALIATTFGFRVRQPAGTNQLAAGLTTMTDAGLEDTELITDQIIEDTEGYANCIAACTNPMQWLACSTNCFTQFATDAANQMGQDTQVVMGQLTGAAGAGAN